MIKAAVEEVEEEEDEHLYHSTGWTASLAAVTRHEGGAATARRAEARHHSNGAARAKNARDEMK